MVYGNKKEGCPEETVLPDGRYSALKLIVSISIQWIWTARHIDFEHAFPNGKLKR